MARKRNPPDATGRNVRAANKKTADLRADVRLLRAGLRDVQEQLIALEEKHNALAASLKGAL